MSEWHTETLGQLVDAAGGVIRTGPFGSQLHRHEYVDDGEVAVVMPKDMIDGRIASNSVARIDRDTAARLGEHLLRPADIVLARRGDIGRAAWVHPSDGAVLCGTGSMRIHIPDGKVAPRYLHYFLQAGGAAEWLQGQAVGATMPNLNADIVRGLPVRYPNPKTQNKIIEILDSIDELIENNRRRIALLEQMAQAIYREWFVHFRCPGHEEDELVDSPLGPIPAGWSLTPLGELGAVETDSIDPSAIEPETPSVGLEHIPRHSFTLAEWGLARDVASRKTRFSAGDVLFGKIRPYFHKVCVAPMDGIASTDAIVFRARRETRGLVTMTMFSDDFVQHAVTTSNGTKMPRADWKVLREWLVPIPADATLSAFEEAVAPTVDCCNALAFQYRALAELRDHLLPKLVTGAIDVSKLNLDALLEAA